MEARPRLTAVTLVPVLIALGAFALWASSAGQQAHLASQPDAAVATPEDATVADLGPAAADLSFNPGWVGSPCQHDADCIFEGGFCLLPEEGFPGGHCTLPCQHTCPDRVGDLYSQTFCMEDPSFSQHGVCVARCNLHLTTSGCRPGYACATVLRLRDNLTRLVCLPDLGTQPPATECTQELDRMGLQYSRPDLEDSLARAAREGDPLPISTHCQVDTPVLLASPLHGVDFREAGQRFAEHLLVACRFAPVLDRLAALLAEAGVVEVQHVGTFNCRSIAGTRSLSGHGRGLAIDVVGFERSEGAAIEVQRDWTGTAERQAFLRQLVQRIREARLFDVVLTPASNEAHADHLHLEIR
ncbi:MAG: extensin family protein [Pseudomonadota bacterium]